MQQRTTVSRNLGGFLLNTIQEGVLLMGTTTHWLSGWPKKSPNFIFATKMVIPKSLKFMNSGSELMGTTKSSASKRSSLRPNSIFLRGRQGQPRVAQRILRGHAAGPEDWHLGRSSHEVQAT